MDNKTQNNITREKENSAAAVQADALHKRNAASSGRRRELTDRRQDKSGYETGINNRRETDIGDSILDTIAQNRESVNNERTSDLINPEVGAGEPLAIVRRQVNPRQNTAAQPQRGLPAAAAQQSRVPAKDDAQTRVFDAVTQNAGTVSRSVNPSARLNNSGANTRRRNVTSARPSDAATRAADQSPSRLSGQANPVPSGQANPVPASPRSRTTPYKPAHPPGKTHAGSPAKRYTAARQSGGQIPPPSARNTSAAAVPPNIRAKSAPSNIETRMISADSTRAVTSGTNAPRGKQPGGLPVRRGTSSAIRQANPGRLPAAGGGGGRKNPPIPPHDRRGKGDGEGGIMFGSVMKAIAYIVFVIVASGFLSYYSILFANDVFALVKSDAQIFVNIPEYATISDIAEILDDTGIIEFPSIFELYASFKERNRTKPYEFVAGSYTVSPSMNYDALLSCFQLKTSARSEISITIREGQTVNDIIKAFTDRGIGEREKFIDVVQNGEFDFWFVPEAGTMSAERTYRLEGYLFPDTYYFYTDSTERAIILKFLNRFDEVFDERYREACEKAGMTVDEVITLASMIQAEGKFVSEFGDISSVFHNRLKNPNHPETMGYLNSDATIQYALDERKSELTNEDTQLDSPYNSYTYKGLPPGPICNPSMSAVDAAIYPNDTPYYYFVARKNGYNLFSITHDEHLKNIVAARNN